MSSPGILCTGSIVADTIVYPYDGPAWGTTQIVEALEHYAGGNGANTARAIGRLGTPVRLAGGVGSDAEAERILLQLTAAHVDTQAIARLAAPTAATVVLVNRDGSRQFLHRLGASRDAFRDSLDFTPALCAGLSHYHFASLFVLPHLRTHGPDMLRRARAAGFTTSLDTNWDPEGAWLSALAPCLPYVDILFMNEDEAYHVTGSRDPAEGARLVLDLGVKTSVMKLGSRGCGIFSGNQQILCPPYAVDVKDTTGAGDCFVAGFLATRQRGADWNYAGDFANAVGALSVQHLGAITGVLSYEETEAWMKTAQLVSTFR